MHTTKVGIFIFDGVDVLDLAGPFEVFCRTRLTPGVKSRHSQESAPFDVFTIGDRLAPVTAAGGLQIMPQYDFASTPRPEIFVVPGGLGTRKLLQNDLVIDWIRRIAQQAERASRPSALDHCCLRGPDSCAGVAQRHIGARLTFSPQLMTPSSSNVGNASSQTR